MRAVLELSADIRYVSTGGLWTHDRKEGWIRFVVTGGGVEHTRRRLYVQWFSQAGDNELIELLSTVPVVELNGPFSNQVSMTHYSFEAPECEDKISCTRATLKMFDTRSGKIMHISLLLDEGPGHYKLAPQALDDF